MFIFSSVTKESRLPEGLPPKTLWRTILKAHLNLPTSLGAKKRSATLPCKTQPQWLLSQLMEKESCYLIWSSQCLWIYSPVRTKNLEWQVKRAYYNLMVECFCFPLVFWSFLIESLRKWKNKKSLHTRRRPSEPLPLSPSLPSCSFFWNSIGIDLCRCPGQTPGIWRSTNLMDRRISNFATEGSLEDIFELIWCIWEFPLVFSNFLANHS